MTKLQIAKDLSLPADVVTQVEVIIAKRRAGKSYTMRRLTEQLLKASQQVVLVDPKGDQWGLRSSADGKRPGFPILILGGEHGDLPLEVSGGELVARLIVEERVSVLIDLSQFRKHEVATFMTAFLENLYRLKAQEKYRTPVKLIVDEADAVAPQKPQKGEERMLGAIEDIVRRGGQRGIGCTLVTQRSAVLNKNVLTQAQILVVLRTIAPQDLAAMKAWIEVHGTIEQGKELMDSLPSLPIGDAWFWSPGWPTDEGIFKRVHVLPIETFDSGATPKPGQKQIVPKNLADVDIDALKSQMAATIEKAKENDPKALKAEIATLKRALVAKNGTLVEKQVADPKAIEAAVNKAVAARDREWEVRYKKLVIAISKAQNILSEVSPGETVQITGAPVKVQLSTGATERIQELQKYRYVPKETEKVNVAEITGNIGGGGRKILIAIAQHDGGITREHLSVLTGYKTTSRNEYVRQLKARGFVVDNGDLLVATQEGVDELGSDYEPLPTGQALQDHVMRSLPAGEQKILAVVIERYPDAVSRDEISEATNYKTTSRNEYLRKLYARKLVEFRGDGVIATDKLFD